MGEPRHNAAESGLQTSEFVIQSQDYEEPAAFDFDRELGRLVVVIMGKNMSSPQVRQQMLESIAPAMKDPAGSIEAIKLNRTHAEAMATNAVRAHRVKKAQKR